MLPLLSHIASTLKTDPELAAALCQTFAMAMDYINLSLVQTISTIPASMNQTNIYPAEVLVSPDGKFVYLSNRDGNPGPVLRDNIAVFSVDSSASDGVTAKLIDNAKCGHYPRSMTLSFFGFWLGLGGVLVFWRILAIDGDSDCQSPPQVVCTCDGRGPPAVAGAAICPPLWGLNPLCLCSAALRSQRPFFSQNRMI